MRKLFLALFVLCSFFASAQKIQKVNTYGYEYNRFISDTLFALPGDTFAVPAAYQSYPFLARKATTLFVWNTSSFIWEALAVGGTTDSLLPANIFYTSDYGCVSDAALGFGSTTFGTNNTDSLQAILDNASGTNPIKVIVNGKYSATQLKIKSNTEVYILPGCGFIQRDNSNTQFIVNYNRSTSIVDSNIYIHGGIINGNGGVQAKQDEYGWVVNLRFAGVRNLTVKDVILYNAKNFASFTTKFENVVFENIFIQANSITNQDGLKFLTGDKLSVKNIIGKNMGDDVVSFVSNDVFWTDTAGVSDCSGGGIFALDSFAVHGNISNVYADGIVGDNARYGVRLMSSTDSVNNVTINNVYGTFLGQGMIIDNFTLCPFSLYGGGGDSSGFFNNISFNNINLKLTGSSSYEGGTIFLNSNINNISFTNIINSDNSVDATPFLNIGSKAVINHLRVDGYTQVDKLKRSGLMVNAGAISTLLVSNSIIDRRLVIDTTYTNSPFIYNRGTVTNVSLDNNKTYGIKHFIDVEGGKIKLVNATNSLHRGISTAAGLINVQSGSIDTAAVSNYIGKLVISGAGTVTVQIGDAFPSSGSGITALTGDVTASGTGSVAATLATVNSNVGSFTNTNLTVNGKGLITAASSADMTIYTRQQDTITLASFPAGARFEADTALFSTTTIYGSFYNDGSDTLVITKVKAVMNGGTSDTLGYNIYYNDTINVVGSTFFIATEPVTSTTTGDQANADNYIGGSPPVKIPPGNWVWLKTPTVVAGRKPYYFSVSIIGYKKRVY